VTDFKTIIDEAADLMQEFRLNELSLKIGDHSVTFRRNTSKSRVLSEGHVENEEQNDDELELTASPVSAASPMGIPVTSPMTGIFYNAPSPGAPAYVKVGDEVSAGQVIGLIEAMKVFNEIPCPVSGTVFSILVSTGQVLSHGEILMYVG
jgi:acetyl-CoA carboxylase biotin carboxyl carrier protein